MTKLLHCTCKSSFQDSLYGGKRVVNQTKASDGKVWRCTICLREHSVGADAEDSKKKKEAKRGK